LTALAAAGVLTCVPRPSEVFFTEKMSDGLADPPPFAIGYEGNIGSVSLLAFFIAFRLSEGVIQFAEKGTGNAKSDLVEEVHVHGIAVGISDPQEPAISGDTLVELR
jgi:hypothetical protein